ncbi:hypothetical protein V1460_30700 [Streptomyces sp. SCSIO 30461]|uniref:sensor histidine kinase n=1 Tax=Streptomyces sp. SCSIO 30461 TaxID=3118085 RepID=UPI0030CC95D1
MARAITVVALPCFATVAILNALKWGDPDRSRLTGFARQAPADVRLVSSGYRDMSPRGEAESAAAILTAAEVDTQVDIACGRLHPVVDTVLATALREGVTNALRHSKVQRCSNSATVDDGTVLLGIVNDGARHHKASTRERPASSGLDNLRQRLTEIGGRLTAELREDGRFHLEAYVPTRPRTGDDETPQDTGSRAGERTAA